MFTHFQFCPQPPRKHHHLGSRPLSSAGALQKIPRLKTGPQLLAEPNRAAGKRNSTTVGAHDDDNAHGAEGAMWLLEKNQNAVPALKSRSTLDGGGVFGPSEVVASENVSGHRNKWTSLTVYAAVVILSFLAIIAAEVLP